MATTHCVLKQAVPRPLKRGDENARSKSEGGGDSAGSRGEGRNRYPASSCRGQQHRSRCAAEWRVSSVRRDSCLSVIRSIVTNAVIAALHGVRTAATASTVPRTLAAGCDKNRAMDRAASNVVLVACDSPVTLGRGPITRAPWVSVVRMTEAPIRTCGAPPAWVSRRALCRIRRIFHERSAALLLWRTPPPITGAQLLSPIALPTVAKPGDSS